MKKTNIRQTFNSFIKDTIKFDNTFLVLVFLIGIIFSSCDFNFQTEDSILDIEDGKKVCLEFLKFEKEKMIDSIIPLMIYITPNELKESLQVTDSILGEVMDFKYLSGKSNAKTDLKGSAETKYIISYSVNRSRKKSRRIFHLIKKDNVIRVQGYEDKFDLDLK